MTDSVDDERLDRADATRPNEADDDGADGGATTVEAYEVDGGTVLYDSRNPLAWVESSVAVVLTDSA
jgi:hypothetical protein